MPIRQIEVDEYDPARMQKIEGRLVVQEFAGDMVLIIRDLDGTSKQVKVVADDLWRAWRAVNTRGV